MNITEKHTQFKSNFFFDRGPLAEIFFHVLIVLFDFSIQVVRLRADSDL
jgi:hypothetical protein